MKNSNNPKSPWLEGINLISSFFTIIGISLLGLKGNFTVSTTEILSLIFCCISSTCILAFILLSIYSGLNNQAFFWEENGRVYFWISNIFFTLILGYAVFYVNVKWLYHLIWTLLNDLNMR